VGMGLDKNNASNGSSNPTLHSGIWAVESVG